MKLFGVLFYERSLVWMNRPILISFNQYMFRSVGEKTFLDRPTMFFFVISTFFKLTTHVKLPFWRSFLFATETRKSRCILIFFKESRVASDTLQIELTIMRHGGINDPELEKLFLIFYCSLIFESIFSPKSIQNILFCCVPSHL